MLRFNKNIIVLLTILIVLSLINIYINNNQQCPTKQCTDFVETSNYGQDKVNKVSGII
jgi:hypothetical protein